MLYMGGRGCIDGVDVLISIYGKGLTNPLPPFPGHIQNQHLLYARPLRILRGSGRPKFGSKGDGLP